MVNVFIRQRILREPPPVKFVVTTCVVVRERQACECLIFLAVEAVAVIRNRQRRGIPPFSERLVVVTFEHVILVCRHDTHASQMIGQEITNLGVVAGCCHDPAAAERRTLEYTVASGIRTVCKKNPRYAKPQSSAFTAESFVPSARYEYFATIVRYLHRIIFFIPLSFRLG